MAYNKYEVLGIERDNDNDGKPRVRLVCREPVPPEVRMNLSKADAVTVAQFEALIGQTAMLPCRTGQTDAGLRFLVLEQGEPFAMPPNPSKPVETAKAPAGVIPPVSSMK
ncbi:MAG: hypothetical protein PHC99_05370 [Methylococcales bacterium]|nr:hypothetical protein [Methylococcales bacterium]